MIEKTNILIVKHGALGDVVRTSFFAKPLRRDSSSDCSQKRLYWLTAPPSVPLVRYNPHIDVIVTDPREIRSVQFETIYSLDDEDDIIAEVAKLHTNEVIGAQYSADGRIVYCDKSAPWFDMGLLSKHGKERADQLKRLNERSHSEIFKKIFEVDFVDFKCYNSACLDSDLSKIIEHVSGGGVPIGLNAFAGKRWPSKALPHSEFAKLAKSLSYLKIDSKPVHVFLFGSGEDYLKNKKMVDDMNEKNISAIYTDDNILELMAAVRSLKLLVTSDSLCLHLAVGQGIPTVAFFAPTSAAEIESLPFVRKVRSLAADYCSYKPSADNATVTCDRIVLEIGQLANTSFHD